MSSPNIERRAVVRAGVAYGLVAGLWGCSEKRGAPKARDETGGEESISPAEDLMREHGVLNRLLLVYEEVGRRLAGPDAAPTGVLAEAGTIVRAFIEDYHEKLEEDFLFPRFEKANTLVDLVQVLRRQHQAGRILTERIRELAAPPAAPDADAKKALTAAIHAFVRMYRPHEAREDTVLFPALRRIIPAAELDALCDRFESEEHARFGKEGFEGVVEHVASLERELGIHDLAVFTPT
jgi:hemerythrin-like domain-containing protein